MASDLFADPVAEQLAECQKRFLARINEAIPHRNNRKKRREIYQRWREEFGDIVAKESAKYVEALLDGKVGWPKFAK